VHSSAAGPEQRWCGDRTMLNRQGDMKVGRILDPMAELFEKLLREDREENSSEGERRRDKLERLKRDRQSNTPRN
jgi:hypothetical protein